jgi:hypothetical protein
MIARKPRMEHPVALATSSTVLGPSASVSKTLLRAAAPMMSGGA